MRKNCECRWCAKDHAHCGKATQEQQQRVVQLHVSGPRDHVPHVAPTCVDAERNGAIGVSQPNSSTRGLDLLRQSAIVDELVTNSRDPINAIECDAPDEHGPTCGSGNMYFRVRHPRKWIQHLEKVDECWNQRALGSRCAIEPHHFRDKVKPVCFSLCCQRRYVPGCMHDVCIGEQNIISGASLLMNKALVYCPKLSTPPCL